MNLDESITLWCKFSIYFALDYTNGQISKITGSTKRTVAKYRQFKSVEDVRAFYKSTHSKGTPKRDLLASNEQFFIKELKNPAGLSNSQIMDHFKEHYPGLPPVSQAVLSRYLTKLRTQEDIIRVAKNSRVYRRRAPEGEGKDAQVDFGETFMYNAYGQRIKVHFLIIVLSYSKFKFIYLIGTKFDAEHAVYALHRAFEYFGGYPESLILDNDRVWKVSDKANGDCQLTRAFDEYVKEVGFKPVFCKVRDPESKGRVEKYVHFTKNNFLKGREFVNFEQLNRQAIAWLARTGNGQRHDLHNVSPSYLFHTRERQHLKPYTYYMEDPDWKPREYAVNKDNTIRYGSCFYALPPGSYRGQGSKVLVDDKSDMERLLILDIHGDLIVDYPKTDQKNAFFPLPDGMLTEKPSKHEQLLREKFDQWQPDEPLSVLLQKIRNRLGERSYKTAYKELYKALEGIDGYSARRLVKYCADNDKTTLAEFMEAIALLHIEVRTAGVDEVRLDSYDFSEYERDGVSLDKYDFSKDDEDNESCLITV